MNSEPRAFKLCLEVLQLEHENTQESYLKMLNSLNLLSKELKELNENNFFKVTSYLISFNFITLFLFYYF